MSEKQTKVEMLVVKKDLDEILQPIEILGIN